MKVFNGMLELILAIPFIGAALIWGLGGWPLIILFFLHLFALIISINDKKKVSGPIIGMLTSLIGFIPVVGWIIHLIAAIVNISQGLKNL